MLGNFRFDPLPEAGWSRGLTLVLDAHTDQITSSSIPHYFQALFLQEDECYQNNSFHEQGFEAIIDTRKNFPTTTRKKILIKPGHLVQQSMIYFKWIIM